MSMAIIRLAASIFLAVNANALDLECPATPGESISFEINEPSTIVSIPLVDGLCLLTVSSPDGTSSIPVARSYSSMPWERAGGGFAATLEEWSCADSLCQSSLPVRSDYVLQSRIVTSTSFDGIKARFLEYASFGATRESMDTLPAFGDYVKNQINDIPPTFHREVYRRQLNPIWRVNKPQFAAQLNPCAKNTVWSRKVLNVKDAGKRIRVLRVGGRWQLSLDGHVRTMVSQLRVGNQSSSIRRGNFRICPNAINLQRGVTSIRMAGVCQLLRSEDLIIDFPADYNMSSAVVEGTVGPLRNRNLWQELPDGNFLRLAGTRRSRCQGLSLTETGVNPPSFLRTNAGEWLQYIPRAEVLENSLDSPLADGGHTNWARKRTRHCSTAPRSFFNEDSCIMSNTKACTPGSRTSDSAVGSIVCGSPNEVANDPSLGDSFLDITSIFNEKQAELAGGLVRDTITRQVSGNQREFVWSQVVLTSNDQLRQRVAWALFQIFAMPKISILRDNLVTEPFLSYYDIFVRNGFGNFRDVLLEISFHPLMAESLSYRGSISLGEAFSRDGMLAFPDENFARELMQLFTIGLVELNEDGTPTLDSEGNVVQTYTSDHIVSFARVWTGFNNEETRANIEGPGTRARNQIDPIRITPSRRDKFPKPNLYGGFLGDGFPLCSDLPSRMFLRAGAKFRLLGNFPVPEMEIADAGRDQLIAALHLELAEDTTGLFEELCGGESTTRCTFPSVVVLSEDLECGTASSHAECLAESVQVVKVGEVFYEFIPTTACTRFAFYGGGIKAASQRRASPNVCLNPEVDLAGAACCITGSSSAMKIAAPVCQHAGERLSFGMAEERCEALGMAVCDYRQLIETDECPRLVYQWTGKECKVLVKINSEGNIAVVHETNAPISLVQDTSPSYFGTIWDGSFPLPTNNCDGVCAVVENGEACLCEVETIETPVFTTIPPGRKQVLEQLHIGFPEQSIRDSNLVGNDSGNGFTIYDTPAKVCCDEETVFEVIDHVGGRLFLRNLKSSVRILGSSSEFRNPPTFNSLHENRVDEALHETMSLLDHLYHHKNTAPFIAHKLAQRFGTSNPSPRYIREVARAFTEGTYSFGGHVYGSGDYGDLSSTVAAIVLDRERRSSILDNDPFHGSLREPLLKVVGFMRAMEFVSARPLVELNNLDGKIGQMAFEQKSVFSFFRPEHSPPETSRSQLVAPEAQVLSSGRLIGLLNGLFALVEGGLNGCEAGFGLTCNLNRPSGSLLRKPSNSSGLLQTVGEFASLLTAGRMEQEKQEVIARLVDGAGTMSFSMALRLILTSSEFHSTQKKDPSANKRTDREQSSGRGSNPQGYRAVIHLSLQGGCDSFNVLVPHPSCPLNEGYKDIRGSIALGDAELLDLGGDATGQPCSKFSLHNSLPYLKQLYDDGDLSFLANTGILTKPVDKSNFQDATVTRLFSHNTMQDEVDTLDPLERASGTGTLGRLADALLDKDLSTDRTAIESSARNLFGKTSNPSPIYTLDETGVQLLDLNVSSPVTASIVTELNGEDSATQSGVYGKIWSSRLSIALNQTERIYRILQSSTPTQNNFSDSQLGRRFELIAQLIATREQRGVERDFFFVSLGGWDMHAEVTEALRERLDIVNSAIEDLVEELKYLGVWDDVTIIQTSEFGRTLTPNSGGGSDHGWGQNVWFAGGSVKGGKIVGEYPSSFEGGSSLNIGRGRLIPTTPIDSLFHGVAQWMGVDSPEALLSVLPNKGNFQDLFSEDDLFL